MIDENKVKEIVDFFGAELCERDDTSKIMLDGKEIVITNELNDKLLSMMYADEPDIYKYDDEIIACFRGKVNINSNAKELREVSGETISCKAA